MIGNPQSDGTPPLVLQAPRRLARCLEQECVWPRSVRTQQPVLPILDHRILADVGQVPADQSKMMIAVGLTDDADPLQRRLVANVTPKRITGVGGVDDPPAAAQRLDGLAHVAPLRRDGM